MTSRRLPGFRFEVQPPQLPEVLPRMDIACFVGFAASGPLHRPVAVESVERFEMIFGKDQSLAWDETRGETVYAFLAPAVRAFFQNGGRRAWIIRVAGLAQTDHFALTGLLQADFDDLGELAQLRPAYAQARSPGSWADAYAVCTSLLAQTVDLRPKSLAPLQFVSDFASPADLIAGDLVRLTFEDGSLLVCAVKAVEPEESSPLVSNRYTLTADKAVWFKAAWQQVPGAAVGEVRRFSPAEDLAPIAVSVPMRIDSPLGLAWPTPGNNEPVRLNLQISSASAPQPGEMLRVTLAGADLWLRVQDVRATLEGSPPGGVGVQISGQGLWQVAAPAAWPGPVDLAERLGFELWARAGEESALRLSGLTFDLRHPRCWDALPTDLKLFPAHDETPDPDHAGLWQAAADPRFPLAGAESPNRLYVPLALPFLPDFFLRAGPHSQDALTRDGLDTFGAGLFLDPDLAGVGLFDLMNEANALRYESFQPRRLSGLHAALEIEEVTLIAVPDAVHGGWQYKAPLEVSDPPPSDPPLRPEWWHFQGCDPRQEIQAVHEPEWGQFQNCDIRIIEPPVLAEPLPDAAGTFTCRWQHGETGLIFILEEATRPDFKDAVVIYSGPNLTFTFYGHASGTFYYRTRAFWHSQSSDWSNGEVVLIAGHQRWVANPAALVSSATLETLHRAVLRMCAARGDLFAVLALPEHYRPEDVIAYRQQLVFAPSGYFGPEEPRTLSFGALYHPWLVGQDENQRGQFRRTPPDGAVVGSIARRTLGRGAWIAPAGEPLLGLIALNPPIERDTWQALQDAQINLIRHEPKGFIAMNADTLSTDPELRLINVRRLLILLRRLAFRQGANYVFEPNDAAFRRSVQRGFEAMLDLMFAKGAFAGATAAQSYRVVTGESLNTPTSLDLGRLIVELRVAPSKPMRFLTIRLLQKGDHGLALQEG